MVKHHAFKIHHLLILVLLSLPGFQCTAPRSYAVTEGAYQQSVSEPPILTQSLFKNEEATISEEDIQRILSSDIVLPDSLRIAVLNYGSSSVSRYYASYWSSEEYLRLQQDYIDLIEQQLAPLPNVRRIQLLPKLVTGTHPTISTLRESAVRLQADLLFIFSIHSDIYTNYRLFNKNEAKAYATCETLLLDIRTGIIPHAEVATRDTLLVKFDAETGDEELRRRAETEASRLVLREVAERLRRYVGGEVERW